MDYMFKTSWGFDTMSKSPQLKYLHIPDKIRAVEVKQNEDFS